MAKSMVYRMQIELVQLDDPDLPRAIKLRLDGFETFASFYIGDVPGHRTYLPTAYRKLRELLSETHGAWCAPNRKYPVNGLISLTVPFAIWYEERDRSIHITAPPAPKLHLRLVDRRNATTQSQLYRVLFDLLEVHDKIPASVYA